MSGSSQTKTSIKTIRFTKLGDCSERAVAPVLEQMDVDHGGDRISEDQWHLRADELGPPDLGPSYPGSLDKMNVRPEKSSLTESSFFADEFCASSSSSSSGNGPDRRPSLDPLVMLHRIQPFSNDDWQRDSVIRHVRKEKKLIKKEFSSGQKSSDQMWVELKKRIETIYHDYELIYSKNENGVTKWDVRFRRSPPSTSTSFDPQANKSVVQPKMGEIGNAVRSDKDFEEKDADADADADDDDVTENSSSGIVLQFDACTNSPFASWQESDFQLTNLVVNKPEIKDGNDRKNSNLVVEPDKKPRNKRFERKRKRMGVKELALTSNGCIRKQAKNAYHFFVNDERPKVIAEFPDLHINLVFKEVGRRWRNIAPDVKQQYEEKAFNSLIEFSEYQSKRAEKIRKKTLRFKNGGKAGADDDGGKQISISFGQFAKEQREEIAAGNPHLSLPQITCKLKEMWKEMHFPDWTSNPDWMSKRAKLEKRARKKQERIEMEQIKKELRMQKRIEKERLRKKSVSRKVKLEKLVAEENSDLSNEDGSEKSLYPIVTSSGQKRKIPLSAYKFFFFDVQASIKLEHPDWSSCQVCKEISNRWKEMSGVARRPYFVKARAGRKEFFSVNPKHVNQGNIRHLRPYNFFAKNERPLVKAEYPQMSNKQIFREVAARWRDLSDDAKKEYATKANENFDQLLEQAKLIVAGLKTDPPSPDQASSKRSSPNWLPEALDECLSETIASFEALKTPPQNETEAEINAAGNNEDEEPEAGQAHVSKELKMIRIHDIDGIAIAEMGYQGDDEDMESGNGKGTAQEFATIEDEVPAKKPRVSQEDNQSSKPGPPPQQPLGVEQHLQRQSNNINNNLRHVPAKEWSIDQVADFVGQIPGCGDSAKFLRQEEIDGIVFLQLNRKDLLEMGLKTGPAFKISFAIDELAKK